MEKIAEDCGYTKLVKLLKKDYDSWKKKKVTLAVMGATGVGKSSFINKIRR